MAYTRHERLIAFDTPLGEDAVLLQHLSGVEGISTPFRSDLDLLAETDAIAAEDLIAQRVVIAYRYRTDGTTRYSVLDQEHAQSSGALWCDEGAVPRPPAAARFVDTLSRQ